MAQTRETPAEFEKSRIKALQEERLHIQKKTFTKWINSFLQKARMEVEDLFTDLADGKKLLKLLEIISGEKLGKPNNGRMRVHKIENVNKSLAFLHTKVRLESIGAEDIVDGNPRLILGLIWTIILRFQIQEIEIDVDEEDETSEKKSAKDALLLWCQRRTNGYPYVEIQDFTSSWVSGMGFNALIHAHRPDLIDFNRLDPQAHMENLNYAFNVAERELNIPRLLDAEDIDTVKPDEKSVITYVASYYHCFAKMKSEIKGGRRIANIVGQLMEIDQMKVTYDEFTRSLLEWIRLKIGELDQREFENSLEGIRAELAKFKTYRTVEKPPKYKEWSEIEALFFGINMKLSSLNQPPYAAPDGQSVHDIQSAWEKLERAEHRREVSLRDELMRQERLENLAQKFLRKAVVREGYLKEMHQVLSDPRYGCNIGQIDATVKKHEAISADILARRERLHDLVEMAKELERENYRGKESIKSRSREIMEQWQELLKLLEKLKVTLSTLSNLMSLLREAETVTASVKTLEDAFKSEGVGIHLMDVEDLLQKHAIQETEASSIGETIKKLNKQAQTSVFANHKESPLLIKKLEELNDQYKSMLDAKDKRRALLEEARNFFTFMQNHEDEEAWIVEKQRICQAPLVAKDLRAVLMMQQKHKALEDEVRARKGKIRNIASEGEDLIRSKHKEADDIKNRLQALDEQAKLLDELTSKKRLQLQQAIEGYQFYADVNEAESWMKEKLPLVKSVDFGSDEPSSQALLARHKVLEGEIQAYKGDVQSLNAQGEKLIKAGNAILTLSQDDGGLDEDVPQEEWVTETRLVPQEVWVDEPVRVTELVTVTENITVNQVRALYAYEGHGMKQSKGEIMVLLKKTNDDWWNVRKQNGQDGYVPASYVKEIEPKLIPVKKRKPETITKIQKVKKTKMIEQKIKVKKPKPPARGAKPKAKQAVAQADVDSCVKNLNRNYDDLVRLTQERKAYLEDSVLLFKFYQECDDLEKWMKDQERILKTGAETESVADAKMKFEKFVTDMSAATHRLEELDKAAANLEGEGNTQMDKIRRRQKQIHSQWKKMNQLKEEKEKSLEGATSVELFGRTCDEACDWMREKMMKMDTDDLGPDLKTVQALQRKHTNLERELAPVEQKVERVNLLAESVMTSYPMERANVLSRQKQLQDLWKSVKSKAQERRARLEDAVGEAVFNRSAKNLLLWVSTVKEQLNADESANDLATAEALLKKHADLGEEIKGQESEFQTVKDHGRKLLTRKPSSKEAVEKSLVELEEEENAVRRGWQEKEDWLRQCRDLQVFEREADHLDTATSAHEAFLEFQDLGESVDAVEALLKRHDEFENMLIVQDERLKGFVIMSDKLLEAQHVQSGYILERRNAVVARRQAVKENASERRNQLLASRDYHAFMADAEDMANWMSEKYKLASDESYRDLSNLERKLQKQEAFVRELRANEGRLMGLRKAAQVLVNNNHYRTPEIKETINKLNTQWEGLWQRTSDRGQKLGQASAQHGFNKTLEDAKEKLDDLEKKLNSHDVGNDLRSCKQLLHTQQALENDMEQWQMKIADMVDFGKEMANDGHFDADAILRTADAFQTKFDELKTPMSQRREALEKAMAFYEFAFEVDAQKQWILDKLPLAKSETVGQTLHEAQSLDKKHKKLMAELNGHEKSIEKTMAQGHDLITMQHPHAGQVEECCEQLARRWKELIQLAEDRGHRLDLVLKAQQFYAEENEVESWLNEKQNILKSQDYGKNEEVAKRFLARHKALELELDTYEGIVNEMGSIAQGMAKSNHPEAKMIENRHQLVSQQVKNLQKLATARRQNMLESLYRHEYFRECDDLEQWINECIHVSESEDYGKDWEHLEALTSKFADFKHRVNAGAERVKACRELANKLISSESPYSTDIEKRQEQLNAIWEKLNENIEIRDEKLLVAADIHRFNKDVSEALERIQEKKSSVPEDVGRDLHSVESLLKKHDGFENDLVALEAKLQILVNDAAKLREMYPGQNAETIGQQQTTVVNAWEALKQCASERKERLTGSLEFHRFMSASRDLLNWAESLRGTMMAEEKIHDAASAQMVKNEHERIKAEIESREESFASIVKRGEELINDKTHHRHHINDIKKRKEKLLEERQKLHATWHHKKVYLDQLIDLHFFLRDAKQLTTICQTQQVTMDAKDNALLHDSPDGRSKKKEGLSIEQVDAALKKHEAFEKVVLAQEEKYASLQIHGEKLVQQSHFDSNNIAKRMEEVGKQRRAVKERMSHQRYKLEQLLLDAQFNRDVEEAQVWIAEKLKNLESPDLKAENVTSLEDKVKKLKKHQAVQAEIKSHEARMKQIMENGERLLANSPDGSGDVKKNLEQLHAAWKALLRLSRSLSKGFEEAQDILDFNSHVEKAESWIKEKELMVSAADTGKDYEHCLELQRKLDDVDSEVRVDDSRMKLISDLADKIISRGHANANQVLQKREDLNQKWRNLQGVLNNYRARLASALEIHAFYRDVGETKERIHEKMLALSVDDTANDLLQVEALQRRQEVLERDISVISGRIKELDADARRLTQKYPDSVTPILQRLSDLQESWRGLTDKSNVRKQALAASHTFHKFKSELHELDKWSKNIKNKMTSMAIPASLIEAEANLQLHQERKAEIDGRQDSFKALKDFGHRLIQQGHRNKDRVEEKLNHLEDMRRELMAAWEERKQILHQAKQLQEFLGQADEAEEWLSSKEAFLNNEDYGESMATVEALMRKHSDFEKALSAQEGAKIDHLEKLATELAAAQHYDMEAIQERLQAVTQRRDQLKKNSLMRKQKLAESKQLQQFLSNMYEVGGWIGEKYQAAIDDSYRDLTNLQHKIQKHAAFEAELVANEGRITAVTEEGEKLISANHFAAMDIQSRLSELEQLWRQLQDATQEKKEKLEDAYQAFSFTRTLDDLEAWMDEVEAQLQSEDHGHDHLSTQFLMKKHQALETDYHHHAENMDQVNEAVKKFAAAGHFLIEQLETKARSTVERYNYLQEPLQIRKDNLEDAYQLYQFTRDVDDELMWIKEKEPVSQSDDLGTNLRAAQKLLKKHQTIEAEIQSHEPMVMVLCSKGQQMVKNGHVDSATIETKTTELGARWAELKDGASLRRLRLQDALESHQFYEDAEEVEAWIADKQRIATSIDSGKDEDSVQVLQKKLDSLSRDVDNLAAPIGRLAKQCETMEGRHHFDAGKVRARQTKIEQTYERLRKLLEEKEKRLSESRKLYKFLRESEEVATWVNDQMAVAASEDYGQDVEHIQELIKKYEVFVTNMNANVARITQVKTAGQQLIEEGHAENETIKAKISDVEQLWEDLKDLAQARQDALLGAKQVHAFDRSADETIEWIQEKDTVISSETYGNDLESIQALMRKHHGFERDLAAVKEQVESVVQEAHRLATLFPDAHEHISVKHEETVEAWNNLLEKSAQRKDKLKQAEELQAYFDEYRDLMAWVNEMIAKVTAPELSKDVKGAEALISRHKEIKAEMDARGDAVDKFREAGEKIIRSGHFMSSEVQEKIQTLETRKKQLFSAWEKRESIYELHLDLLMFLADCAQLESWLQSRQPQLSDQDMGSTLVQIDDLIKKHDDFEKTLAAQEQKLASIKRLTKIEDNFAKLKREEEEMKAAERARQERERNKPLLRPEELQEQYVNPKLERERGDSAAGLSKRLGSQTNLLGLPKRAESMRIGDDGSKKPKRTPSFTTRKRTTSFRKQKLKIPDEMVQLPPVEKEGFLERKQELQTGGKKATIRSWKTHYTVLCGQLLCFFKDKTDFVDGKAASPPVAIYNCTCDVATNYTKKKHVFRIVTTDGAEYLFKAESEKDREEWVKKTKFHASLPPSLQLLSYDSHKAAMAEDEATKNQARSSGLHEETLSSASSRSNSPVPPPMTQPPAMEAPPRPVLPPPNTKGSPKDAYLRSSVPSPPPMHSHPYGREWPPANQHNGSQDGLGELRDFGRRPDPIYANDGVENMHPRRPQSFHAGTMPPPPPPARTVSYGAQAQGQSLYENLPASPGNNNSNYSNYQDPRDPNGNPQFRRSGSGTLGPVNQTNSLPPRVQPPGSSGGASFNPSGYPPRGQHSHASLNSRGATSSVDSGSETDTSTSHRKDKRSSGMLKGLFRKKSTQL